MKISVAQIDEDEGLRLHHLYGEGEPALDSEETRMTGRTELELSAAREGARVKLAGKIKATVEYDCDRCLSPQTVKIDQDFDLLYIPPAGTEGEHELGERDLSVGFYQGDFIDADDLVREQVVLALPMVKLCADECRGLCPECGANLNQGACSCPVQQVDPRWEALKGLKSN
jgi:uncharacterized protein